MKPVMYIFANRGLGMSPGKLAAQVAHAAVEAYRISCFENPSKPSGSGLIESSIVKEWYRGGHHTKLVMLARDTEHLYTIERYLEERNVTTKLIIDEGRTEIAAHSPTALGCEILDKDNLDVVAVFESFQTYREEKVKKDSSSKGLFGRGR
jgi:peptidyl-tRNA hydrolase